MNYIGIDPSLRSTGLRINDKNYLINTKKEEFVCDIQRFHTIAYEIMTRLKYSQCTSNNTLICIETVFVHMRNPKVLMQLCGLAAVVRESLYSKGYVWYDVAPTLLKKFATGKGNGSKDLIMKAVYKKYNEDFDDNNLCDAYVLRMIAEGLGSENLLEYEKEVIEKVKYTRNNY